MAEPMNVLVCVKRVPDVSGEVLLTEDGQAVDARYVGFTTSNHESCAVELAVQLTTASGGSATVVTVGAAESVEQLRAALGVGCTGAVLVEADPASLGPADVAREIAAVVRDHEAAGTAYDLVLLGNDAADSGDFQVAVRLADLLERPVVTGIQTIEVREDGTARLRGDGPDGTETFEVPLPAVVSVLEGGVEPRYPTITGRMKAKKVPVEERVAGDPAGSGRVRMTLPPPVPSTAEVLGEGPDTAKVVVDLLQKLGVAR